MKLIEVDNNDEVQVEIERTWVAQHEHDDEVGSFSIEKDGDLDEEKLQAWISKLLRKKGVDIFSYERFP